METRAEKRKKGKKRKERKDFKVEYEVWEKITMNNKTYFSVILINQSQICVDQQGNEDITESS